MILKHIHLVNFKKYRKASIALDSTMVGIFGDNGAGKSSLFEAVTWCLYGVAQSMEGREGVKQQDLIRDGEEEMGVEVEFVLEPHTYRIARYLNAKRGIKSRLWIDGKLQALKSREVSARIEQDLGLNVKGFISSSFIRQKELDLITSAIASERKKLINRLFNLRVYEQFEEAARDRKKGKENELEIVKVKIRDKGKDIEKLPLLEKELQELKNEVDLLRQEYEKTKNESESVRAEYTILEEKFNEYRDLESRLKVVENNLENTQNILGERRNELEEIERALSRKEELNVAYSAFLTLKERLSLLETLKSQYDARVNLLHQLETEITVTQKSLEERTAESTREMTSLKSQREKLEKSKAILLTLREKIAALEDVSQRMEEETQKMDKIREKDAEVLVEKTKYTSRLTELQEENKEVQSLGIGAPCPKCRRPLQKEHLEELTAQYAAEIEHLTRLNEKCESKEKHLNEMKKEIETHIKELKEKEGHLENLKKEEQKYSKEELMYEDIQKRITDLQEKIEENKEKIGKIEEKRREKTEIEKEIEEMRFGPSEYESVKKEVDEKVGIQHEMIKLEERISKKEGVLKSMREAEKTFDIQKKDLEETKTELKNRCDIPPKFEIIKKEKDLILRKELAISEEYTEKKTQYEERTKERERLQESLKELEEVRKKQKEIEDAILTYAVLQDAFKQIPVQVQSRLRPRIRKETSDLLKETTDGKYPFIDLGKDYSVTVYYDGKYYPISRFSGGEKDLINLCLRVGISRVLVSLSSQKSFARIHSLFLDECFGSFDTERRKNLLAALNQLRKYFTQIVLITHIDEIKEALPEAFMVEELEDGSSRVRKIKSSEESTSLPE